MTMRRASASGSLRALAFVERRKGGFAQLAQRAGCRAANVGVGRVQGFDQGRSDLLGLLPHLPQGDGRLISLGPIALAKDLQERRQGLGMAIDLPEGHGGVDAGDFVVVVQHLEQFAHGRFRRRTEIAQGLRGAAEHGDMTRRRAHRFDQEGYLRLGGGADASQGPGGHAAGVFVVLVFVAGVDIRQDRMQGWHRRRRLGAERPQNIGRMPLLAELLGLQLIGPVLNGLAFRPDRRLSRRRG